jgi:hypothetical protein
MAGLMRSLLAVVEGNAAGAMECMQSMQIANEPEVLMYLARHYSYIGASDLAIATFDQAIDSGFVCAPSTLRDDPWLESIRIHPAFPALLGTAEKLATDQ